MEFRIAGYKGQDAPGEESVLPANRGRKEGPRVRVGYDTLERFGAETRYGSILGMRPETYVSRMFATIRRLMRCSLRRMLAELRPTTLTVSRIF